MLLRSTASLLILLAFSKQSPALAQVSIGPVSGGILVEAGLQGDRLESSTAGQFTVTVGSGTPNTTIQILAPVFAAGPSPDPGGTTRTATADVNSTTITSGGANDTALLPVGSTTVLVNMQVERPSIFPAGTYQYTVDVVVSPN